MRDIRHGLVTALLDDAIEHALLTRVGVAAEEGQIKRVDLLFGRL